MKYIAVLDYEHLDHSFFMKSFAEAMAMQKGCSGIILHGDSPYTDRLIQTGMMRDDAIIRSTRDLNHRIIALLAEHGISGIGINGFQREIIRKSGDQLIIQQKWLTERPAGTHLILSNLVWNSEKQTIEPVPLNMIAETLRRILDYNYLMVFPKSEGSDLISKNTTTPDENGRGKMKYTVDDVPDDLISLTGKYYFCTSKVFGKLPDTAWLQKKSG